MQDDSANLQQEVIDDQNVVMRMNSRPETAPALKGSPSKTGTVPNVLPTTVDEEVEGIVRQNSFARTTRLTVGVSMKKSPSRLQRISKQLKLSGKY